jgi:hypothetical protein
MEKHDYKMRFVAGGVHILVFHDGIFERKIFVSRDEFRPTHILSVVNSTMNTLFYGSTKSVFEWLEVESNAAKAKMVAVGDDMQLLSIGEFRALYG